ncbi:allantoate deiminase [Paenibacillus sp. DS2015]|uniref:M20 family metallo-hydrolase n=1 Tax=Paenibacillus sp. DS2015 TaxID=3373917 RepID=UPI003D24AE8A
MSENAKLKESQIDLNSFESYGQQLTEMLNWLASFGADETGGVTRLLYSDSWRQAQLELAEVMRNSGLDVKFDAVGNLIGTLQGSDIATPPIVTGSHVDTVISGGKYDGALGVIAGILALAYLKERYGAPITTLKVVSLCEEEGSRFPLAYWGSGSMTGIRKWMDVADIQDRDGIRFEDAMTKAGYGIDAGFPVPSCDFGAYIELHIEQGSVLEHSGNDIGLVTGIVGQKRIEVTIKGVANHAGTTPMRWRKDALAGAASMITALEQLALEEGGSIVATVGQISVSPGTPNVIPGEAYFTLDIRHSDVGVLNDFCERVHGSFLDIAEIRELNLVWVERLFAEPIPMNEMMIVDLERICVTSGLSAIRMSSGAGHDAQIFQPNCPTAMIFVPSENGISHSPLEYTAPEQMIQGFRVLTQILYQYGYGGENHEPL